MNCVSPAIEEHRQKRGAAIGMCLLAAVCFAGTVFAQEFRGSITGLVTDPSGAVVAGARVTVTNVATNATTWTLSNPTGNYTLLYLTPGQYTVTAEATGFKKLVRPGVQVWVGDRLELDVRLELGGTLEGIGETLRLPAGSVVWLDGGGQFGTSLKACARTCATAPPNASWLAR